MEHGGIFTQKQRVEQRRRPGNDAVWTQPHDDVDNGLDGELADHLDHELFGLCGDSQPTERERQQHRCGRCQRDGLLQHTYEPGGVEGRRWDALAFSLSFRQTNLNCVS